MLRLWREDAAEMAHPSKQPGDSKSVSALTPEQEKRRRARNIAIALAIGGFILLFYVVTIVKLGGAVTRPPA